MDLGLILSASVGNSFAWGGVVEDGYGHLAGGDQGPCWHSTECRSPRATENHPAPHVGAVVAGPCSGKTAGCSGHAVMPDFLHIWGECLCGTRLGGGPWTAAWFAPCPSSTLCGGWTDSQVLLCGVGLGSPGARGGLDSSSCCSSRGSGWPVHGCDAYVAGRCGGHGWDHFPMWKRPAQILQGLPASLAHHFQGWVMAPQPPLTKEQKEVSLSRC